MYLRKGTEESTAIMGVAASACAWSYSFTMLLSHSLMQPSNSLHNNTTRHAHTSKYNRKLGRHF